MEIGQETHRAKDRHTKDLMQYPGVVGVVLGKKWVKGERTDEDAVIILVIKKKPLSELSPREVLPQLLDGAKTDVIESREIWALKAPTDKWRPAPGGVSIGHYKITAGTLGCLVMDNDMRALILSNNHVLANSGVAELGDPILQPGAHDGGLHTDEIAGLETFIPINFDSGCAWAPRFVALTNAILGWLGRTTRISIANFGTSNTVDCALAAPHLLADVSKEILDIGLPSGITVSPLVGMEVQKSGRTTGYTTGEIIGIEGTIKVNYGEGRIATFEHQIVAEAMSAGGDSGSLVLDMEKHPVGLLFAGSDEVTIINEIDRVLTALEVEFPREGGEAE